MKKWVNEEYQYLREVYIEKFNDEIANIMNQHFNGKYRVYTAGSISAAKDRYKLHSKPKFGKLYTREIIEFIQRNYKGKDNLELSKLINEKFNLNTDADKISMLKVNLKRRFGIDTQTGINRGCYKKGQTPTNKGKKWDEYLSKEKQERCRTTTFKKGNKPLNAADIGEERMRYSGSKPDDQGYLCVKICDGKGNKNWVPKQRVIYEQYHGPIPPGYKVIFADGNRFNFDINNLILVTDSEELIMNKNKLRYDDKDLTKTGVAIAKVIDRTNKLRKK